MDKDESEIILIVFPVIAKYINEAISDRGIVKQIIRVALHLPKKKKTTIHQKDYRRI